MKKDFQNLNGTFRICFIVIVSVVCLLMGQCHGSWIGLHPPEMESLEPQLEEMQQHLNPKTESGESAPFVPSDHDEDEASVIGVLFGILGQLLETVFGDK